MPVLCLLALAGGAALCLWRTVFCSQEGRAPSSVGREKTFEVKASEGDQGIAASPHDPTPDNPVPSDRPPVAGVETVSQSEKIEKVRKPVKGKAVERGKEKAKGLDLSAYEVRAISSDKGALLPRDRSLSVQALSGRVNVEKPEPYDGGKGWLGNAYRGAKRLVDSMDEATLNASQKALGRIAEPESAKIRLRGGKVRLHIEIPPEKVKIRR